MLSKPLSIFQHNHHQNGDQQGERSKYSANDINIWKNKCVGGNHTSEPML